MPVLSPTVRWALSLAAVLIGAAVSALTAEAVLPLWASVVITILDAGFAALGITPPHVDQAQQPVVVPVGHTSIASDAPPAAPAATPPVSQAKTRARHPKAS